MDIFHAIILAFINGFTEFLPVSSTGHMFMAVQLMQLRQDEFYKIFQIALQMGAMVAIVLVFWRTFLLDWEIDAKLMAAFVPSAVIGLLIYKLIKHTLLGNAWVIVWAWFIGGAFMILVERFYPMKNRIKEVKKIGFSEAIIIGSCQALGVIPGVSGLAATVFGGFMLGIERKTIVEFSFLLGLPTLFSLTVYDVVKADASSLTSDQWIMLLFGFLVSFLVAWGTIKFLVHYIQRHNFTAFGVYRVIIALAAGLYLNLLLS